MDGGPAGGELDAPGALATTGSSGAGKAGFAGAGYTQYGGDGGTLAAGAGAPPITSLYGGNDGEFTMLRCE